MEVDFENLEDYASVPPGTYLCEIALVRETTSKAGDPMWGLCLRVAEGQHVGHLACWDNLVFSDRGRPRVRDVFAALGLPSEGRVQIDSQELVGRRAFVEVYKGEYRPEGGDVVKVKNQVPYDGYRAATSAGSKPEEPSLSSGQAGESVAESNRRVQRPSASGFDDHVPF